MTVDASSAGVRRGSGHLVPALLSVLCGPRELSAQSVSFVQAKPWDELGYHIARLNDVDGDKHADVALDDRQWTWMVSGKSGNVIARDYSKGGGRIEEVGSDLDGDGAFDLVWIESSK